MLLTDVQPYDSDVLHLSIFVKRRKLICTPDSTYSVANLKLRT